MMGYEICSIIETAVGKKLFKGVFLSRDDITLQEGEVAIIHAKDAEGPGHWTAISRTDFSTFEVRTSHIRVN